MVDKRELVRQSNAVTTAAYNLGRNAKRLLYLSLIQLSDIQKLTYNEKRSSFEIVISTDKFKTLVGSEATRINRVVLNAAKEMATSLVVFYTPDLDSDTIEDEGDKAQEGMAWLAGYKTEPKKKRTILYISKYVAEIIPFRKGTPFTQYLLTSAVKLNNVHAMRVYESICQWRGLKNHFKFNVSWMIERYQLPKSYKRMPDFRSRFLKIAQQEINENTDIKFTHWDEHCDGERKNAVTHITLHWKENVKAHTQPEVKVNTLDAAIKTYAEIIDLNLLPTSVAEIANLLSFTKELSAQNFSFDLDVFEKIAKAKQELENLESGV